MTGRSPPKSISKRGATPHSACKSQASEDVVAPLVEEEGLEASREEEEEVTAALAEDVCLIGTTLVKRECLTADTTLPAAEDAADDEATTKKVVDAGVVVTASGVVVDCEVEGGGITDPEMRREKKL